MDQRPPGHPAHAQVGHGHMPSGSQGPPMAPNPGQPVHQGMYQYGAPPVHAHQAPGGQPMFQQDVNMSGGISTPQAGTPYQGQPQPLQVHQQAPQPGVATMQHQGYAAQQQTQTHQNSIPSSGVDSNFHGQYAPGAGASTVSRQQLQQEQTVAWQTQPGHQMAFPQENPPYGQHPQPMNAVAHQGPPLTTGVVNTMSQSQQRANQAPMYPSFPTNQQDTARTHYHQQQIPVYPGNMDPSTPQNPPLNTSGQMVQGIQGRTINQPMPQSRPGQPDQQSIQQGMQNLQVANMPLNPAAMPMTGGGTENFRGSSQSPLVESVSARSTSSNEQPAHSHPGHSMQMSMAGENVQPTQRMEDATRGGIMMDPMASSREPLSSTGSMGDGSTQGRVGLRDQVDKGSSNVLPASVNEGTREAPLSPEEVAEMAKKVADEMMEMPRSQQEAFLTQAFTEIGHENVLQAMVDAFGKERVEQAAALVIGRS